MKRRHVLGMALLLVSVGSGAAYAQGHGDDKDQGRGRGHDKGQPDGPPGQVSREEQARRIQAEQQRAAQYRQHLDHQVPIVQQQAAQLHEQQREAQARVQADYAERLRAQQQQIAAERRYESDPYVTTPHSYRYMVSGSPRQTNQYGADVLRQAVNNGYQLGFRSGEADRTDRRPSGYRNSIAYRDANYGYSGNYVDRTDYNYYFRQGFTRGYSDGYASRNQYGNQVNGSPTILGTLLNSILGLSSIR